MIQSMTQDVPSYQGLLNGIGLFGVGLSLATLAFIVAGIVLVVRKPSPRGVATYSACSFLPLTCALLLGASKVIGQLDRAAHLRLDISTATFNIILLEAFYEFASLLIIISFLSVWISLINLILSRRCVAKSTPPKRGAPGGIADL